MIGAAFDTMAAGFGALGRISSDVTDGVVAFLSSFLANVDEEALRSLGGTISSAFELMASATRLMGQAFAAVDLSALKGIGEALGGFSGALVGEAIKGVAAAIQTGADALMKAAGALKAAIAAADAAIKSMPGGWGEFSPHLVPGGLLDRASNAISGKTVTPSAPQAGGVWGAGSADSMGPMPARASGGVVKRGTTYQINERGVETLTLGRNGHIQPAGHGAGGGGDTYQTFHITSTDPRQAAEEVARVLGRGLNRSGQISIDGRQ